MSGATVIKFFVTDESQRLARWLRLLGYDTVLIGAQPLGELYRRAYEEGRTIVTRNRRVRPSGLFRVAPFHDQDFSSQLRRLVNTLGLRSDSAQPFSRCDRCNVEVMPIKEEAVQHRVPPHVFRTQKTFRACPSCRRIYWAATHCERARTFLAKELG